MTELAIDRLALSKECRKRLKPAEAKAILAQLTRLIPPTQQWDPVQRKLVPKLSKYITDVIRLGRGNPPLQPPTERQTEFLMLDCEDAYYGGAAGGGKSVALLLAFAQFAETPGYSGLIFRKTFSELKMSGALMDIAGSWWDGLPGVTRKDGGAAYEFQTTGNPARLTFGYLENERDKLRYQSANFHYIGADEVTMFEEADFTFMFSRKRRAAGSTIPLRVRSASNPNGPGRLWVKNRYVVPASRGNRGYVPAKIDDNIYLDREDYKANLAKNLGPIEAAQLLHGDWEAQASGKFMRHWFKIVTVAPIIGRYVRYWDLAATAAAPGKDPSWTAGVLVCESGGQYFIVDAIRVRLSPKGVEDLIKQTAILDRERYGYVTIKMEQEPGSAGVNVIAHYMILLAGYEFKGDKVTGPRELRANAFASQAEAGNVFMLSGSWNKDLLDELEVFPGGGHDDQVIGACGAFNEITGVPPVDTKAITMIGSRLQPDW